MVTHKYHRLHRLLLDSGIHVSPTDGSTTSGGYNEEASFDSNMVIVLVALLCALVCALGLNSIVRCALRCTRIDDYEVTIDDPIGARLASSNNLKKEALRDCLPLVVYKTGLHILATDCAICLGEFVEGEEVRIFPKCSHGFHVRCIDRWLVVRSSCPTCRCPLIENSMSSDAERVSVHTN